jgi:molecular chaperone DnaK
MLGEFEFSGFRIGFRGDVKIDVNFEINTDGMVNVSATDLETGQKTSTTITLSSGLSEADIQKSIEANKAIQRSSRSGQSADLPSLPTPQRLAHASKS